MLKLIYRVIILLAIFVLSLSYFSRGIKEVVFDIDNTTSMEESTLPLVSVRVGVDTLNLIHGYSSNLDANIVRDSIIPLEADKAFELLIDEKAYDIKKLNYEVREFSGNNLMESDSVSVFDDVGDLISARIKLKAELKQGKEYALKIALVTSESRKIYFYQRIKVNDKFYLNEKIAYVMSFHEAIKDKEEAQSIIRYLEPSRGADNSTLAYVNIHSSFDLITWGNLKPVILTEIIPTVKEINRDTASIELKYIAAADIDGRTEQYRVTEFYRVRYTKDRMYLLNYERYMNALFDISLTDASKNALKLGITNDLTLPYAAGADKSKLAFVRDGQLWFYDLNLNQLTRVFTFKQENTDYIRDIYDQHDIRIINMDAEGNIYFAVYGYMNRGQYEGRVGLLLYQYIRTENRIEEKLYIPVDEPYPLMKEKIGDLLYVNAKDEFIFHISENIYSYSFITKKLNVITSGIDNKHVLIFKDLYCTVWQENANAALSDNIYIMNLETGGIDRIQAPSGYGIVLMDKIESNIIYGFVDKTQITTMIDGYVFAPVSRLEIASKDKTILKSYLSSGYYISDILVEDNIIELKRVIMVADEGRIGFELATPDSIMSQKQEMKETVRLGWESGKFLKEYYIILPSEYKVKEQPDIKVTVNTVIAEDPTVRINEYATDRLLYYPYTVNGVSGAYESCAEAILLAKEGIGVVVDSNRQLIWERGIKALSSSASVPGFDSIEFKADFDSIRGSLELMLKAQGLSIPTENINISSKSAYEILQTYAKYKPIRLSGISLDDALYYVAKGKPVFAMTDNNKAVVIYGYDAYNISVADPASGKKTKIGLQSGTKLFEEAGNIFISYLE